MTNRKSHRRDPYVCLQPLINHVGDADADSAAVVGRVVNAVGDTHAAGIGAEVVIVHPNWRAIPFDTGVFEIANQFAFLTIDADDRKTLTLEASPQRRNMGSAQESDNLPERPAF